MTPTKKATRSDEVQLQRLSDGLRMVTVPFPHFAGLVQSIRVFLDERVPTMGVFASGRLAANPAFVRSLKENELIFVLAHELFHLALRTHDRAAGSDLLQFNYAHDYIINDLLRVELQFPKIPAGGLDWPGARLLSAEEILLEMAQDPSLQPSQTGVWQGSARGRGRPTSSSATGSEAGSDEIGSPTPRGDVLDGQLEREWFPDENAADLQARSDALKEAAAKALSLGKAMNAMKGRGQGAEAGASHQIVDALRGIYRTPWELMLQNWLESVAPGARTFVRASRRGAERTDLVMPGRKREGWILNIILDTSGSMTEEIPRALGAIADFCEAVAVEQIRLVQCDTAVTGDQFLTPEEAARHAISGFGGSDLSAAMQHLAVDPQVEAVVILTDGEIDYLRETPPYDVLWVVSSHGLPSFRPSYGAVVHMHSR